MQKHDHRSKATCHLQNGRRNNYCNTLLKIHGQFRKSARKNVTQAARKIGRGASRRGQFCATRVSRFCAWICEIAREFSTECCNNCSVKSLFRKHDKNEGSRGAQPPCTWREGLALRRKTTGKIGRHSPFESAASVSAEPFGFCGYTGRLSTGPQKGLI